MTIHPRTNALLAIICISYFMVILDNSIIFTGLPQIEATMQFTPQALAWVTNAYVLVFGGFLLLGARAGDLLGRRRVFMVGLTLFGIASALVGMAPFSGWLIVARAIQGLGAAILAPTSMALLTEHFEEGHQRGRAVAAYSAVAGIGASAGLVIGGLLASTISWRAGFFLNIPIAIAMIVAGLRVIPATQKHTGQFDVMGALAGTSGMTALVFGINNAAETGWTNPLTIGSFVVSVALLALFVMVEARAKHPIMPLFLFTNRQRLGAYLSRLLYLGAMMGFFFFTTQYMQGILHFSPLQAGMGFLPMSMINFVVALLVVRLVKRFGGARVLIAGTLLTSLGMAWLSLVTQGSNYWLSVALPMVLIGIGQGLAFAPMTSFGLTEIKPKDAGAASGVVNTFHQVGSALGLSILVAMGAALSSPAAAERVALQQRVNVALLGSTILLGFALIIVLTLIARSTRVRGPR
jgi:EmrB/QacA subfamily drug resistance transporter